MKRARREFSPEFKREAVALLESSGRPQMQIAAELGIQPSMLRAWRAARNGMPPRAPAGQAATTSQVASPADLASENAKLRRELERTRMERDVLKRSHRHLRGGAEVRFAFIRQHAAAYRGRASCAACSPCRRAATTLGDRGRRALAPRPTVNSWPRSAASRPGITAAMAARACTRRCALRAIGAAAAGSSG